MAGITNMTKRMLSSELEGGEPNAKRRKTRKIPYRYPQVHIDCEMPRDITVHMGNFWAYVHPIRVQCEGLLYWINNWMTADNKDVLVERSHWTAPEGFLEDAEKLLRPLDCLIFNRHQQEWAFKSGFDKSSFLDFQEKVVIDGFMSDMASSRGRACIHEILSQLLLPKDSSWGVINCGGRSRTNEPSVRSMNFNVKQEDSPRKLSPESSPERASPRIAQQKNEREAAAKQMESVETVYKTVFKQFVPDIIVERRGGEILVVEVKKGPRITGMNICQLQYLLIPRAIREGSALGLLICSTEAILMKYVCKEKGEENELKFGLANYRLTDGGLVNGLLNLLLDLRYNMTV